jgi:diaminohydroxyphosphoribosylaminopyrimidine deaminase/5-amino-6-(5-phosphoribosylamino)uracil reductase
MRKAYELAKNAEGMTSPNPCVGAVVVKNGKIIGKGFHKKAGESHAEILAIKSVKSIKTIKGADMYVTLEPCCHYGKTPPCTNSIITSGIKNVFIGMKDPFKKVCGKGIKSLERAGVKVEVLNSNDELAVKIRGINQPFLKFAQTGLPYVIMKAGMSVDGKIATSSGKSKWITEDKSRLDARFERGLCDAVVVGANTIKTDNPELVICDEFTSKKILKIIFDGGISLNPDYKIFRGNNVLLVCGNNVNSVNKKKFEKAGIEILAFKSDRIPIREFLKVLAERGIQSVFVEGGGETHGRFYDAFLKDRELLDKIIFYIAPMIIGGRESLSAVSGDGIKKLFQSPKFSNVYLSMIGDDLKYEAILNLF